MEATTDECLALGRRMGVPSVRSLECTFHLMPDGDETVLARGHLRASVIQTCVVSLEDFEAAVEERFVVRFVPSGTESDNDDDPESIDEIPFDDRSIDLGEAASEQLGLALDPYPRKPGAMLPEGSTGDHSTNPFAALAALRRKA